MNRKLRTTIPISRDLRIHKVPDYSDVVKRDSKEKQRQAKNFNQRDAARELPVLEPGEDVYLPDKDRNGTVVNETATRSYIVQTDEGAYRRNHRQIIPIPPPEEEVIPQSVLNQQRNRTEFEHKRHGRYVYTKDVLDMPKEWK